jgi:excisionase family DNA binding protein
MNAATLALYREYLHETGAEPAAAALTLADVLQRCLDAGGNDALKLAGPADPTLLTVPEAAQRLRLSRRKVYEMCRTGELAAVRAGRACRIPAAEITRFEAGERTEAAPSLCPSRHGF